MRPATSFTRQHEMLRCPRRFHFRYLADGPHLDGLKLLTSVRELGGHVIHSVLADTVRRIAGGQRISDQTDGIGQALREFNLVVKRSRELRPGILLGQPQLAESYNDVDCRSEIGDWQDLIPVAVEHGIRLMHYFQFRSNKENEYELLAEQRTEFRRRGRQHRFVIDALITDERGTSVIDWKTHSITDKDLNQVALYQQYLLECRQIPPTRLFGFAVDLIREQVVERHYRKIDETYSQSSVGSPRPIRLPRSPECDPYPAKPSVAACSICPFATICSQAEINKGLQGKLSAPSTGGLGAI